MGPATTGFLPGIDENTGNNIVVQAKYFLPTPLAIDIHRRVDTANFVYKEKTSQCKVSFGGTTGFPVYEIIAVEQPEEVTVAPPEQGS
jgi:hypothetical protein